MKRIAISFLLGVVCVPGIQAQGVIGFGAVSGTVRDYTGAGIPDTTVVLANERLGVRQTMDTTDDGGFSASALVPGAGYTLEVSRNGFENLQYKNFEVLVGHTIRFKISLIQAPASKRVEAEKASVQMEDETIGLQDTMTEAEVADLPTRQRDVETLAPLTISATQDDNAGQLAFHSEAATNATWLDGILTTKTYYYNQAPLVPPATQESVEEMQTFAAGAPAEYSHTMGGTLNIVTRAGGNAIHGAAYDYYNDNSLDATDRFGPGFTPSGYQHQYGANVGGPLLSKLFWFVNFEDVDRKTQELNLAFNPLLTNPAGTAVLPGNCTATAVQCASALSYLNGQINNVVDSSLSSYRGLARVDWRPNDFNSLNFEADAVHQNAPNGSDIQTVSGDNGAASQNGTYGNESRYAKVGYTAVWSGNAVNDVRAGWYLDRFSDYANSDLLPSTKALGVNIAGTLFGGNPDYPEMLSEQRYQIVDNLTFTAGSHSIKFGVDYSFNEDFNRQVIDSAGTYYFPTLTAFAEDYTGNTAGHKDYSLFTQTFGQPVVDLHTKTAAVYAQDTWSPVRRLTMVIGILWQKPFIPKPVDTNPTFYETGTIPSPDVDFAPRLGLAYKINDRTVIRAGLGTYYQPFSGQLLQALYTGNAIYQLPATVIPTAATAPIFSRLIPSPGSVPVGSTDVAFATTKLRMPYSAQGTVTAERQLGQGLSVSLNYLYNRGIGLWTADDQNLNFPSIPKSYTIENAAGAAVGTYSTLIYSSKSNADFAHVYQIGNEGSSWYNGASIRVRKQMSHGITAQASYTWSHALDDISGNPIFGGVVPANTTPEAWAADKGNSSFDQPNRVVMNWTWQPVFTSNDSWMNRYLVNGWQLSGIGTFSSGLLETPLALVNGQQFSGVTMPFTTTLNGSGGWARVPFEPVNSLSTGPEYDVDMRLTRALPITDRIRGLLMLEAFNAFNTQYNTSVANIAYIATSGILKPVPGVGMGTGAAGFPWGDNARHLQLALKITF